MKFTEKIVLGTVQLGMDYGITNLFGKPSKKEVFRIFELAWEKGVRRFDTAPNYGSETLLGEFIAANGLQDEAIVLTKIPNLNDNESDPKIFIRTNLESSLKNLNCPVGVLFFHNPADSILLLKYPKFFEKLLQEYPISILGVSLYEPEEVEHLFGCLFELAFQFPFNVIDRRFEKVSMPHGKRYARSVFMQGLLAESEGIRSDAHPELLSLHAEYHDLLAQQNLEPVSFAVSFVANVDTVDYFLFGVQSEKHLRHILDLEKFEEKDIAFLDTLQIKSNEKWIDPRTWD